METTATLRRQIELAEELRSVTSTMKSLAAVTVHQYERSVHALHEYVRTVELGLLVLVRERPELVAAPVRPDGSGRTLVVAFGSARGMCGPLNRHVANATVDLLDALAASGGPPATVMASGPRVAMELEATGHEVAAVLEVPASADGIAAEVETTLVVIDEWRSAGGGGRVVLVHPRPQPGRRQYELVTVPLLPIGEHRLRDLAATPWPTNQLPSCWGDWPGVVSSLTRQLLFVGLHRAHAETQVCIHRARLAAMQGAEDSIDERLEELSGRYHRRRQAAITSELLDVVSGYEAAGGPDSPP